MKEVLKKNFQNFIFLLVFFFSPLRLLSFSLLAFHSSMRSDKVLKAFEWGLLDDGRAVGVGYALAPSMAELPASLSGIWNPDQDTLSVADFAKLIEAVTQDNQHERSVLGAYRYERTRAEASVGDCIVRDEPVTLQRVLTATVMWKKDLLDVLVATGSLGDADPPVLEATLTDQKWEEGPAAVWGLRRTKRWMPISFEIIVMEDQASVDFAFQGQTEEPDGFLSPAFVPQ